MQPKLTVQERLKDLRVVGVKLTLEELAERTGLSRAALGKYESDETAKDISPFAIQTLAKFYGVSTDYLLGLTENKNHPNTELNALHLSDEIAVSAGIRGEQIILDPQDLIRYTEATEADVTKNME